MRWILFISLMASCSDKGQDVIAFEQDTLLLISEQRTEAMKKALVKADDVIKKEEERIESDLKSLQSEVHNLKASQKVTKVIYVHDTIMIKEKTNFWGRKKLSIDSITSIDSTEY